MRPAALAEKIWRLGADQIRRRRWLVRLLADMLRYSSAVVVSSLGFWGAGKFPGSVRAHSVPDEEVVTSEVNAAVREVDGAL
ncbi:hypothetical protein Droror1_Dr00015393 [Drosera rotundifolia]